MHIAYVAYTERNVLMLDQDGVCVRVEPLRGRMTLSALAGLPAEVSDGALRCIGAQYVASIDPSEPGGLARLPRVGTSMLFAAVDHDGRIYCVRAGPLTHFESSEDDDSGVHEAPPPVPPAVHATAVMPAADGPNGTLRQEGVAFDDPTDPGFGARVSDFDLEDEPTTSPYPAASTQYARSRVPQAPVSRTSVLPAAPARTSSVPPVPVRTMVPRVPTAPLPAVQPSMVQASSPGTRVAATSAPPSTRRPARHVYDAISHAPRVRPPAPSAHAWLRNSPAAAVSVRPTR